MSRIMRYMVPKRVEQQMGAAEMDILIRETCVAEIVHVALCLLSPTIYHFCLQALSGVLFQRSLLSEICRSSSSSGIIVPSWCT